MCSTEWLESALPELLAASERCDVQGKAFLHLDVRSDNICIADGRAVLVDWNWACLGNPLVDLVFWLPPLVGRRPVPVRAAPGRGRLHRGRQQLLCAYRRAAAARGGADRPCVATRAARGRAPVDGRGFRAAAARPIGSPPWNVTLPSSAAAPAATGLRSAPRSSAPRPSASRRSRSSAAPASASAASRRRPGSRPRSR